MSLQSGLQAPVPAAPAEPWRPSDGLTWLGGADRDTLRRARSGRNHFVQMGLVVLVTAGLGVLSMAFALRIGLRLHPVAAVAGGLIWGCVLAIIDRFLITSLNLRGGRGQVFVIVVTRVLVAALLGFIVSTPLVLQVFQREIQAQIVLTNTEANTSFGNDLRATAVGERLRQVRADIAAHEAVLRGDVDAVSPPEVQNRERYLEQAQQTLAELRTVSDQKYRAWQCELYGTSCEGSTNVPGNGNLARAREQEYRTALAQTESAQQEVEAATATLAAAREQTSAQGGTALRQAQDEANAALPGLRERAASLQAAYDDALDSGSEVNSDNNGLLAQIIALHDLGERDGEALLTHIAVALLFFLIEILPVTVKILSSLGPPSVYERVREMTDNSDVEDAKIGKRRENRERDELERHAIAEAKKRNAVEDDMRHRERDLGIMANERVAKEMEHILDAALTQWARDVQATLGSIPVTGVSHGAATPGHPVAGGPQATQTVRTNFTLPLGHKLGPTNGATP